MINFDSFDEILPIQSVDSIIGISPDREDGNIIVTQNLSIVYVLTIVPRQQVHVWMSVEKITCKVVYNRKRQKYVGVYNHRKMFLWDLDEKDISKSKCLKFDYNIIDLICFDDEMLILFADGSYQLDDPSVKIHKVKKSDEIEFLEKSFDLTISDAKVHTLANCKSILTFMEYKKSTNELNLVHISLNNGERKVLNVSRKPLDVTLTAHCLLNLTDFLQLKTIWSDGKIYETDIEDVDDAEKTLERCCGNLTHIKPDRPISMMTLSPDFIAMYGETADQDGASLILYSTRYKLVRAQQYLKVYFDFSRIWFYSNHILLAFGRNLYAISYYITKDRVLNLIGIHIGSEGHKYVTEDINDYESLEEDLTYVDNECDIQISKDLNQCHSINIENVNSANYPLADGKTVAFTMDDKFDQTLKSLTNLNLDFEIVRRNNRIKSMQLIPLYNTNASEYKYEALNIINTELTECGASEHEISASIMAVIIKNDMFHDVTTCMRRYKNISEKTLASALNYVLNKLQDLDTSMPDTAQSPTSSTSKRTSEKTLQTSIDEKEIFNVLDAVLQCTFEHTSIIFHLCQTLTFNNVIFLLEYIYKELTSSEIKTEKLTFDSLEPTDVELESRYLSWSNALLTSHCPNIITTKDKKIFKILNKWHTLLKRYRNEIFEMERLCLRYTELIENNYLPLIDYGKWYSVYDVVLKKGHRKN